MQSSDAAPEPPAPAASTASDDGPVPGGPGVPCGVAPVRPSEPPGAVGLILATFVQDTVPAWATSADDARPDADPMAELGDLCRRAEGAGADARHGVHFDARFKRSVVIAIFDDLLRGTFGESGDVTEQGPGCRVEIDAHPVDAALDHGFE